MNFVLGWGLLGGFLTFFVGNESLWGWLARSCSVLKGARSLESPFSRSYCGRKIRAVDDVLKRIPRFLPYDRTYFCKRRGSRSPLLRNLFLLSVLAWHIVDEDCGRGPKRAFA